MVIKPNVILFDLGGVVVRWVGIQALSNLTGLSVMDVTTRFQSSKIGSDFEKGLCTNQTFIEEFRNLFSLNGTDSELTNLWNSWVQDTYEGIEDIIHNLKSQYRIACLSNTNDLHWNHLKTYLDLDSLFTPAFASHEIQQAKPEQACYSFVIEKLAVPPSEILFLDDTQANIDAAIQAGMQAHIVDPDYGAIPVLKKLALI